jgi:hypothetical protein
METSGRKGLVVWCIFCFLAWSGVNAVASKSEGLERKANMGEFVRPKAEILAESALVPESNLLDPPPNQFTHEVTRVEPYYFRGVAPSGPDGTFPVGARVLLVRQQDGGRCRVIDERGLYVEVACDSLRRL